MHVKNKRQILALALCIASGCSPANNASSDMGQTNDLSSRGSDLSGGGPGSSDLSGGGPGSGDLSGGGGDMSSGPGLSALALYAGQLGGPGFADLQGPSARFNAALRLTWDRANSLYVAELSPLPNVRQVALASGAVTTLARMFYMQDLVADGQGNLYYLENTTSQSRVHKMVIATGVTSVVAGNGIGYADGMATLAQFNGPYGLTWDGGGNLYVAEASNHTIRKVVPATGAVTTVAGTGVAGHADGVGTSASFYSPRGVALDGLGNLNGDYETAYIGRLTPTRRRSNQDA
jgi:hypothetical protein